MSDLDKKLDEIIKECITTFDTEGYSSDDDTDTDRLVGQFKSDIEKYFIADGWIKIPQVEIENNPTNAQPTSYTVMGEPVMTGREWFSKFEQELYFYMPMHWATVDGNESHEIYDRKDILRLAKKASGIE